MSKLFITSYLFRKEGQLSAQSEERVSTACLYKKQIYNLRTFCCRNLWITKNNKRLSSLKPKLQFCDGPEMEKKVAGGTETRLSFVQSCSRFLSLYCENLLDMYMITIYFKIQFCRSCILTAVQNWKEFRWLKKVRTIFFSNFIFSDWDFFNFLTSKLF